MHHDTKGWGWVIAAVVAALGVFIIFQIITLWGKQKDLKHEWSVIEEKVRSARTDNDKLRAELEYFAQPENLEKELRLRFNYRKADEKMIIVLPSSTTP